MFFYSFSSAIRAIVRERFRADETLLRASAENEALKEKLLQFSLHHKALVK